MFTFEQYDLLLDALFGERIARYILRIIDERIILISIEEIFSGRKPIRCNEMTKKLHNTLGSPVNSLL